MLRHRWIVVMVVVLLLSMIGLERKAVVAETGRLMDMADASVYEMNPDDNFDNDGGDTVDNMRVRGSGSSGNAAISYFTVDLSQEEFQPHDGFQFVVHGRINNLPANETVTIHLHAVADTAWSESGITWNNRPAIGVLLDSVEVGADYAHHYFDITDYVQGLMDTENQIGLALVTDSNRTFFMRGRNYRIQNQRPAILVTRNLDENGRSRLYPEDWYPGYTDELGRFLHDFSYAGYHKGEIDIPDAVPGIFVDVTEAPYLADPNGIADATDAIQAAIDHVGGLGGGVVYLPEGTYRIKPKANMDHTLLIADSGVVLRGAGTDKTYLFNDEPEMRRKSVIEVATSDGWSIDESSGIQLAKEVTTPTNRIFLANTDGLAVGDWVVLTVVWTPDFIEEHNMTDWWDDFMNSRRAYFYRQLTEVDAATGSVAIDVPTRYPMRLRDNASLYKLSEPITEIGLEDFSIGNRENLKSGWAEGDYDVPGTGGYDADNARLIRLNAVANSWVRRIHTYQPAVNTLPGEYHHLSRGIALTGARNVSILDNDIRNPQYRGANGNGYMFSISGNDNLLAGNIAVNGRHNYTFSQMFTNGNVIYNSVSVTPTHALDFHSFLSMANLLDSLSLTEDMIHASVRNNPSYSQRKHGLTTSESVIWNTYGDGYLGTRSVIVESRQYGHGYVIGTKGPSYEVTTWPTSVSERETAPQDLSEGIGQAALLAPQSLYLDQLNRRKLGQSTELTNIFVNGVPLEGFQTGQLVYPVVLPYGTNPMDLPVVTAIPRDPLANVVVMNATALPGQAVITVTSADSLETQTVTLHFTIAPTPPMLVQITVEPDLHNGDWLGDSLRLREGDNGVLALSGRLSNGQPANVSEADSITFSSGNDAIATIDSNGEVTAVNYGQTQLTVTIVWHGVPVVKSETIVVVLAYRDPVLPSLPVVAVTASDDDGNVPENTQDSNMDTRWSANGIGQWIQYDLGTAMDVESVSIAFYNGHVRTSMFEIEVSTDGVVWSNVYSGSSSGTTSHFEHFVWNEPVQARYVRYVGNGNSSNSWNSILELRLHAPE